ncbi:MAG: TonB-dependent receptor plug domain-containing protein [Bacteroidales bacterium]
MKSKLIFATTLFYLAIIPHKVLNAQFVTDSLDTYLEMSLEELMNIEITSVSKIAEKLQNVPSSIYVITSDDIQRSSAPNLMQLLRDNVPGYWAVENEYKNANAYIRNAYEGSVLVLLDGTPMMDLMASTFDYENFDIPLDQIERIEVIKGSGGTIYGANSATGVISIYTKNTKDNKTFLAAAEYAYPGRAEVNVLATPVKSNKFSATFYGKFSNFSGFDQMAETVNPTSVVPKTTDGSDTTIVNRFTGDDNTVTTLSGGLNLSFQATDKLKLTAGLHENSSKRKKYYQTFPVDQSGLIFTGDPNVPQLYAGDTVRLKDHNQNRVVANLRADYNFSLYHSLFARVSTNMVNSNMSFGGGYKAKNNIIDIELQDNISVGINHISFGGNYRVLNYNLSGFSEENQVLFTDNKNDANIIGFFLQDKISLISRKLNFYLGIKAEQFSLLSDNFYLSPMAKFSIIPNEKNTVWGGFSRSFTTPGYNETNVEYAFFRGNSPEVFYNFTQPLVSFGVYQNVFEQAIAGGADQATARAMAEAYVQSPEGMAVIDTETNNAIAGKAAAFPKHYNVAAINGPNTVPTSFNNFELGVRWQILNNLSFETTGYVSFMKNGIGNSPNPVDTVLASVTRPGEYLQPYYYGNYLKGVNMGMETVVKYIPMEKLRIEISHAWYKYTLEYNENDDFDIEGLPSLESDYPQVPEHVFRGKIYFDPIPDLKFTLGATYAGAFFVKYGTVVPFYEYDRQRFDPLFSDAGDHKALIGGQHDNRFILNFRADKYFFNNKLNIYLYASDLLSAPFTEGNNQFYAVYPRQVGGIYGLGLKYMFNY